MFKIIFRILEREVSVLYVHFTLYILYIYIFFILNEIRKCFMNDNYTNQRYRDHFVSPACFCSFRDDFLYLNVNTLDFRIYDVSLYQYARL